MSGVTEEAILCMQHCCNQMNIFFTNFPEICPLCGQSLKSCSLIIPPFRIPSPFVAQNTVSGVLLVKPTKGSFLRDYKSGDDLHVGIVAANGEVYNFDELGLHTDSSDWEQCLAVSVNDVCIFNSEHWNSKLQWMSCSGLWTSKEYDEHNNNCFNFALSFLNHFLPTNMKPLQKQDFCKDFILPLTTKAAQYIDLFRRIQQGGGVFVERSRWK